MDRGESIEKLALLLSADGYGDVVSGMLVEILAEDRKRNVFVVKLRELANELKAIDQEITPTPMEQDVLDFVVATKQSLSASEVSTGMCACYPRLRHRTHASSVLNSLVSKEVLGNVKVSCGHYFTTPVEAVMGRLKGGGEEPNRCSPVRNRGCDRDGI
ncbi:MAG: hypothetical protein C5S47_07680 [Candidatus Methanogasteraceae archaeon]|nr:MAG: hypothetical protein C5S47_07680 [ANME-2 cluster archaeon]